MVKQRTATVFLFASVNLYVIALAPDQLYNWRLPVTRTAEPLFSSGSQKKADGFCSFSLYSLALIVAIVAH